MKHNLIIKLHISLFVIFAICCVCPSAFSAEPTISTDNKNQSFYELHSVLMEVNPSKNYLIIGEQRIELIDMKKGVQRFKTMIRDTQEKAIPLQSFRKGHMVFVRGFELPDGRILAREIYRLPQRIQTQRELRKYHFYVMVPVWGPFK